MSLILRCPKCATEIVIRRRHRGATVPCPHDGCPGDVQVPQEFDSQGRVRELLQDRKRAEGMTAFALASCVIWIPIVPAFVWFHALRRIWSARRENRVVTLDLYTARTTAIVALIGQLAWYAARYAHESHGVGFKPFMSWW